MIENNKKNNKNVIRLDKYDEYIDDELKEKIDKNKNIKNEKSKFGAIFIRIISIISIAVSIYYLFILYEPLKTALIGVNYNRILQYSIYCGLVLFNIFASVKILFLNNLGRIIQFIVLFIFITIRVFDIFYRNLINKELEMAIISIVIASLICIILLIKPVSKAF